MSSNLFAVCSHPSQPRLSKSRQLLVLASICLLLVLGGIFFGPTSTRVAYAASSKLSDFDPIGAFPAPTFVQHDPKVYLVFWGPKWGQALSTISTIEQTFQALAGSQYNNILTQYTDTATPSDWTVPSPSDLENGNYVHNDVELMTGPGAPYGRVIDTTSPPGGIDIGIESPTGVLYGAQIRNESDKEIAANNWHVNPDSTIIVFPQEGTTYNVLSNPQGWCGMHVFNSTAANHYAYALIQYGDQFPGCYKTGSVDTSLALAAVHEYTEAATDPVIAADSSGIEGSGWHVDAPSTTPQEAADLCESQGSFKYISTAGDFSLPYLWSNVDNSCESSIGQEYNSPDTTYPFHGIHTVHGSILDKYQSLLSGANSAYLGEPTSEETPIAGGRASYFVGPCNKGGPASSCAAIYWSPTIGTYTDWGNDYLKYLSEGGPGGNFGFPTSDPIAGVAGGAYSLFQGGSYCSTAGTVNGSCAAVFDKSGVGTFVDMGNDLHKYMNEGGPSGNFGFPTTDPIGGVAGGSYSLFQGGSYCGAAGTVNGSCAAVFDKSGVGTFVDMGNDLHKYTSEGGPGGNFGYPTTDPIGTAGGSYSLFQGGSYCGAAGTVNGSCAAVFDKSGSGTFADWGDDLHKYMSMGGPGGTLGWPLSDPQGIPGGAASYFTGNYGCGTPGPDGSDGAVYFNTSNGTAHEVHGCIYAFYQQTSGGTGGVLGYPLSDESGITDVYGNGGRVNYFTGNYGCGSPGPDGSDGAIYWTGAGYQVYGCIYGTYMAHGGPGGVLGFPVSSEYTNALGYRETDFAYGDIVWQNGNGVVTVF